MHIDKINTLVGELSISRRTGKTTSLIDHVVSLAKESECFNPMIVTSSLSSVRYICSLLNQRGLDIAVEVYHKDARYEGYTVFIDNLEYILDEVLHDRFGTLNVYTNHTI